jgi:hypothetical protein
MTETCKPGNPAADYEERGTLTEKDETSSIETGDTFTDSGQWIGTAPLPDISSLPVELEMYVDNYIYIYKLDRKELKPDSNDGASEE